MIHTKKFFFLNDDINNNNNNTWKQRQPLVLWIREIQERHNVKQ